MQEKKNCNVFVKPSILKSIHIESFQETAQLDTCKIKKSLWSYATLWAIATKAKKKTQEKTTTKQKNPKPFLLKKKQQKNPLCTSLFSTKSLLRTRLSDARENPEFVLQTFSKESPEPTSVLFLT